MENINKYLGDKKALSDGWEYRAICPVCQAKNLAQDVED